MNGLKEQRKMSGKLIKQWVVCVGLMIIIWGGYFCAISVINKKNDLDKLAADDFSFLFQIDEVVRNEEIILRGWAFKLDVNSTKKDMDVYLYDIESETIVYPKTEQVLREDVDEYFSCQYDYSQSGFYAKFSPSKVDVMNKDYEVLIADEVNKKIYRTGTYIVRGEVSYVHPDVFVSLDVEGNDLENIISNGVLRCYYKDQGVYVYQYDKKLYIIYETSQYVMGDTYHPLHLYAVQKELLPMERQIEGVRYDNNDFYFGDKEDLLKNYGEYKVAVVDIDKTYDISRVTTGMYSISNKTWMWSSQFRPYYEFH